MTSSLYLPVGKPFGLLRLKTVLPAPAKLMSAVSSFTVWPSWKVHFAPSLAGTAVAGSEVEVPTEALIVSLGLKVAVGAATRLSAPTVVPRSTVVTATAATGAGGGAGAGAAGSVVAGGVLVATGSSF